MPTPRLVLASTSPFRRELLNRLGLAYDTAAPDIDESRLPDETAAALVMRLAEAKARAVAQDFEDALIIGSDQVATLDGDILGKPGTPERAVEQLRRASGRTLVFHTGLCVLRSRDGQARCIEEPFEVKFRGLSDAQIQAYVAREQPLNSAGSFKVEGLGIALFERLRGEDPNTLIGLPLIRLVQLLATEGLDVLTLETRDHEENPAQHDNSLDSPAPARPESRTIASKLTAPGKNMAFQLCYSSIATNEMDRTQLVNLLKGSRARNQDVQITGLLLYSGDRFLQVLEGPEEAVRATYERIQRDSRHHDLTLMFEETVAEREYPDWSMGFQALEGSEWLEFPNPDGTEKGLRPMAEAMGRAKTLLQDIRTRGLDPSKDI